jgi:ribonuclease BN (tRNA processing enzyme)
MARLVLLGTGTCQLEPDRAASAVLVELAGSRFVFDFGPGVARRLVGLGLQQDDLGDIVLSHFHPDHLSDLVPFIHAALYSPADTRSRSLSIHGPAGIVEVVETLLSIVGFPEAKDAPFRVVAREVEGWLQIGDLSAVYSPLPPAGNHGLRFEHGGRTYAITGDSHYHEAEIEFLRGLDLAIVDSGHLEDAELVELAAHTGLEVLVCSHQYRSLDEEALNRGARERGYTGTIVVARDGMTFAL